MGRVPAITGPHVAFGGQAWSSAIATDFNEQRAPSLRDLWGHAITQYREGIEHIDVIARAIPANASNLHGCRP